jgi:uncharacterized membrane protein
MKKTIFFLLLLICFPVLGYAAGTEKYYIEANILSNGDMDVKELKILSGTYNAIETKLSYRNPVLKTFSNSDADFGGNHLYNGTSITNVKVYAVDYSTPSFNLINDSKRVEFRKERTAFNGEYGVYTESFNEYRIYQPSSYKQGSLITYTIKDVVLVHDDVAEIAWDFISSDYKEKISELIIVINLPNNSKELRVFSHGPLTGSNKIVNRKQVEATYPNVDPNQAIDVRVVFDKSLVPYAVKKSNVMGLERILKFEEERANIANKMREEAKGKMRIIKLLFFADIAFVCASAIYYFLKHDRERKSTFYGKYYREFIEDYNVEVIDYLFNKSITPNAMSASIMNLIYKKKIAVEKTPGKRNKDLYVFTKLEESDDIAENQLMYFLFNEVGNGQKFTDVDLKDYAKSTKTYSSFTNNYNSWKNFVSMAGEEQKFWDHSRINLVLIFFALVILGGFYFYYQANNIGDPNYLYILIGINVVLIIYLLIAKKRTERGNEHYVRWKAFRNFLNDFGSFNDKDLPEIILWERYLVYATVFGLAHKVQRTMNVKIKEMQLDQNTTFGRYSMLDYMMINNIVNSSVTSAVRAASLTASQVAASKASSSGGFGGGSSFGGGGFGGGGSGGGRF